ncbi:hypothetical protein DL767_006212 [Monosporascus sp. MG133]|nr:hypothetical protein DL767_006212 [Monosporascus sp. MG133]
MSSPLLAFLRLFDWKLGPINVDGINLNRIPRSAIRERCFVSVPQEPLLLGQVALFFNLDRARPCPMTLSWMCWTRSTRDDTSAARNAHYDFTASDGGHTARASRHPLLDSELASLPPLSAGQVQLVALRCALLQIHVMSASGSRPSSCSMRPRRRSTQETEALILDIVYKELTCKGYTVIFVAHRLSVAVSNMRNGVDTVVLMADGGMRR